jgi:hypothetical protein
MLACYNVKQDAQNRRRMRPWLSRITFAYMAGLLDRRGGERSRSRHASGSRNRAAGTRNRTRHPRMLAKHIRHQQRIHGGGVMAHT